MENNKIKVNQKQVKRWIDKGLSAGVIEKQYNIPRSVTIDIANGKKRPFFYCRGQGFKDRMRDRLSIRNKDELCACCGFRKKMPGARYLCFVCFALHSGTSGIDEHKVAI